MLRNKTVRLILDRGEFPGEELNGKDDVGDEDSKHNQCQGRLDHEDKVMMILVLVMIIMMEMTMMISYKGDDKTNNGLYIM